MVPVVQGQGADAVGGQELVLVQHDPQDAAQAVRVHDRQQTALAFAGDAHAKAGWPSGPGGS